MKVRYLLLLLFSPFIFGQAKIITKDIWQKDLPKGFSFSGQFVKGLQWKDAHGDNMLLLTETGIYKSGDNKNAEVFAYHFLNGAADPDWKVYDFEKGCPLDVEASFIDRAIAVTDLDGDKTTEIWLVYKMACRGDISPRAMKIVIYEGQQKYAMRGEERLIMGDQVTGGEYEFDAAFNTLPQKIKDYAVKQWKRYAKWRM
ncbi:M949_RS01915 family surface polysaccharide biosynthesis protein [Flavobacterium pallidum]|uniref:VCBS repeat-containing protein n=1 Tax=Flavobacterium pallidum TaxID=2172098 RepID=A0A2S1SGB2_9FLAO|nr:hypothetical protein [Flavobacterium pallidum]AWI25392.1 hypothetical protein HYN49_05480 [Flavobacterium pallidum]